MYLEKAEIGWFFFLPCFHGLWAMLIDEEGVSNLPGLIYGIQKHISFCILPVRKTDIITLFRFDQP